MKAILFGSIGTIAETSEMQRESYNEAFQQHGLSWVWEQAEYATMLERSGGITRLNEYASSQQVAVDASSIHSAKFDRFSHKLTQVSLQPRPGVLEMVRWARKNQVKIAMVTTTYRNVIEVVLNATNGISLKEFDFVCDLTLVEHRKPAADCYELCLRQLQLQPDDCIAIEDNVDGIVSAQTAGLDCLCYPGENTSKHRFPESAKRVSSLHPSLFASHTS